MNTTALGCAAVACLVLSLACESPGPTSPTTTAQPAATPAPAPTPRTFPALSGPSRTFVFDRGLSSEVRDYTKRSRLVLYDTGGFVLQYAGLGEYRGGYSEAGGVMTFDWEGWSVAGAWGATGTLSRDALSIRYNVIMQMSDFEDAVYVQTP